MNATNKPSDGFLFHNVTFNLPALKSFVSALTEQEWDEWTLRKHLPNHGRTKSIKAQWIPLEVDFFDKEKVEYVEPYYTELMTILHELVLYLKSYYNGEIYKIILARLDPHSSIPIHADGGFSLLKPHRVHIPVFTSSEVWFGCSGRVINMKEGEVVEINNSHPHFVVNKSNQHRTHLIIDVIEKKDYE